MYAQGIGHGGGGRGGEKERERERKINKGRLSLQLNMKLCNMYSGTGFVRNSQEMRQLLLEMVTMGKTLMEDPLMKKTMVRAKNYLFCTFCRWLYCI